MALTLPQYISGEIRLWRIDAAVHASTWNSGEGSYIAGGRWNAKGFRAVYASLDPATATLEVAVHKGLKVLDTKPHVLTSARILDPAMIHVVKPSDIPNQRWLVPGSPSQNQLDFGESLMRDHRFVLIPSVVSQNSWNLIFDATKPTVDYDDVQQDPLSIDPRLQPPV